MPLLIRVNSYSLSKIIIPMSMIPCSMKALEDNPASNLPVYAISDFVEILIINNKKKI